MRSKLIRQRRRALEISQDALARELGWTRAALIGIERADLDMSDDQAREIVNAMDRITDARAQALKEIAG